ncbi:MAG TPA: hypothetical protein VK177_04700 [Flavobacteriales bacterium]|nr:hypothetical protein [Flavobacteriales bacterium]
MRFDTRITVGLALVYFLNGLFNLTGQGGRFAPMVVFDSSFLALLSFVFLVLPPFKPLNVLFVAFGGYFGLQQIFILGKITNIDLEIALNIFFLVLCSAFFVMAFVQNRHSYILFSIPLFSFIVAILLGYFEVSFYYKLGVSLLGALTQVLILARPEIVEKLSVGVKRFYLLMSIMVFFDLLSAIFLQQNM